MKKIPFNKPLIPSNIVTLDQLFSNEVCIAKQYQKQLARKSKGLYEDNSNCPKYVNPAPLKISTMTTTCYLSTLVHMKPIFYLLPLFDKERLMETDLEIAYAQKSKMQHESMYYALMSFIHSNQIKLHTSYYCPLSIFKTHFSNFFHQKFGHYPNFTDEAYQNLFSLGVIPNFKLEKQKNNIYPRMQSKDTFTTTSHSELKYILDDFIIGLDIDPIFPCILDIKYKDVARGNMNMAAKKKKKKKAFFNQCTMRIAMTGLTRIVNLKIFQNGKLHMTGCKNPEDADRAIKYLLYQIEMLSHTMYHKNINMMNLKMKLTDHIPVQSFSKSLWRILFMHSDAWDLFEWKSLFPTILNDKLFWLKKCEKDFKYKFLSIKTTDTLNNTSLNNTSLNNVVKWKAIEKYNERTHMYKKIFKSSIFEDPQEFYFSHYDEKQKMPFIPMNYGSIVQLLDINIEMINSDFETYFNINQTRLADILRTSPYNLFIKFDPLNYPGVNIKYPCPMPEDNPKEISILVFRTGQVIITGGTCVTHLEYAYNFINDIFKTHYTDLWVGDGTQLEYIENP
jgi:TATA-box binding protein (TBP) (component of TFIID and TFIIIB)